ncbi:hypothetical protein M2158_004148 [Streptomyces sp. SAI-144]|nr:hypothetical protein [Streptomyces sp. SAI-144]
MTPTGCEYSVAVAGGSRAMPARLLRLPRMAAGALGAGECKGGLQGGAVGLVGRE